MKPFVVFFWRGRLKKDVLWWERWGNLFLQLLLLQYYSYYFHAEPSHCGCNSGDALLFPFVNVLLFGEFGTALKSNTNVLCMERNKPRWFPNLWRSTFCGASEELGLDLPEETTILYQSTACPRQTFTWSTGSLVSENRFSVPKSKELLSSGRTIEKKYWPHLKQTLPKSLLHTTISARLRHLIQS